MYSGIVDESDKKDSCNDFTARMMQMCLKSHSLILLLLLRILPKSRILHYFHISHILGFFCIYMWEEEGEYSGVVLGAGSLF